MLLQTGNAHAIATHRDNRTPRKRFGVALDHFVRKQDAPGSGDVLVTEGCRDAAHYA
jgi:hypothetical protein